METETVFKRYNDFLKALWYRGFALEKTRGYKNIKSGKEKIVVGNRIFRTKKLKQKEREKTDI